MSAESLPAGVTHLWGVTYRVRLSVIQTADGGFDPNAEVLEFRNPRWRQNADGSRIGCGFTPPEMEALRNDIRDNGLKHNLNLRFFPFQNEGDRSAPGGVQLVDGERRFRSISKLVKDNEECWDSVVGRKVPAAQLYEFVECRITWMSDEEALSAALMNNETAVGIGAGAMVGFVRHLRQCHKSDKEILDICQKSPDWLLKTEKLFALDSDTFQALCEDKISRRVALVLGKEQDLAKRAQKLKLAQAATDDRLLKLSGDLLDAEVDDEVSQAELSIVEDTGNQSAIAEAKTRVTKAQRRVKRAKDAMRRPRATITSGKDLESSGHELAKPFTQAKMAKYLYDPVCAILKSKGLDEQGQSIGVDLDDARLVKSFMDLLSEGLPGDSETVLMRFLQQHKKHKDKRQAAVATK